MMDIRHNSERHGHQDGQDADADRGADEGHRDVMGGEGPDSAGVICRAPGELQDVLSIQSLLCQFSHPRVRGDFLSGHFGCHINPNLLPNIDKLRWTLFPWWSGGSLKKADPKHVCASVHLAKFIKQDSAPFLFNGEPEEQSLTYQEWYTTLEAIANDKYWTNVPPKERCIHIASLPEVPGSSGVRPKSFSKLSPTVSTEEILSKGGSNRRIKALARQDKASDSSDLEIGKSSQSRSEVKKEHNGRQRHKYSSNNKVKVEELIILDSDSSDPSESDDSDSGSSLSLNIGNHRHTRSKATSRAGHTRQDRRDIVTPPVFVMDGKMNLKEYLEVFERYFEKKFNGTDYDKTQELSNFLEGKLLEVYKIRGGRKLKYSNMKSELLCWYKNQKIGGKSFWKNELQNAKPVLDESLDIYGMRLLELSQLAYPTSNTECAKQVRKYFLEAIPSSIANKILDAERAVRALSSGTKVKYMAFSKMMEMAKELQKKSAEDLAFKKIMWTNRRDFGEDEPVAGSRTNYGRDNSDRHWDTNNNVDRRDYTTNQIRPQNERYFTSRTRVRSNSQNSRRASSSCEHCHMSNHSVENCWRASRSCLICGQGHHLEQCPNYDPTYNGQNKSRKGNGVQGNSSLGRDLSNQGNGQALQ